MANSGRYIVIEGTDGTGKSTQANLLSKRLEDLGYTVTRFHEPAGTDFSSELRKVIVNGHLERSGLSNALLFTAARRENWHQIALPALLRGDFVVVTRNYYSTLAYQAIAEGLSLGKSQEEDIAYIEKLTLEATDERYMKPDISIILDLEDEEERTKRISQRGQLDVPDTFESRASDFQAKIIDGYRLIAKTKNLPVISAIGDPNDIANEIWEYIEPTLGQTGE